MPRSQSLGVTLFVVVNYECSDPALIVTGSHYQRILSFPRVSVYSRRI